MPKKKKKKKKIKKSSAIKSLRQLMVEDAGKGLENFGKAVKINVFYEAREVKDYKQLERFIETYAPGMAAADVAVAAAKYAKDNWNLFKLMKDPDYHGAIFELLDAIDKTKGGVVKVFNDYNNKKINPLTEFIKDTAYKIPATSGTFQNHITMFLNHFGLKRDKSGKFSIERTARELKRKLAKNKTNTNDLTNYKDYEQTAHGWRKKIK